MKLRSFQTNDSDPNCNPFIKHISDKQYEYMIKQGFETASLNCYADLTGNICYKKYVSSGSYDIYCYITEDGIAVDYDYDCGGNSSNITWWFEDGEYNKNVFSFSKREYIDIKFTKHEHSFEEAWNNMINAST